MYKLVDFSLCARDYEHWYGGSDRKDAIIYNNCPYMIKHVEKSSHKNNIDTSSINNVMSEFISSHVFESIGIPVHETILGYYNDELVVACKNFLSMGDVLQEFAWFMLRRYDSKEIGRVPKYFQIYDVIQNDEQLSSIKEECINRYWDCFIVDALVGNFDRHKNNWGYVYNRDTKKIAPAPVYDNGSALYPVLADRGMKEVLTSEYEIRKRLFVFPKADLIYKEKEKVGYYDFLASGIDRNCSNALVRVYPRIDLEKIYDIVYSVPLISDTRKNFYFTMIKRRKEDILGKAYNYIVNNRYDGVARNIIIENNPRTVLDVMGAMKSEGIYIDRIKELEDLQ